MTKLPENPTEVEIIDYQPAYKEDFKTLNLAWIEKYFTVEPHDLEQLDNPEVILEQGGVILFAQLGGVIIGTCALINEGEQGYELAKMAVSEAWQGRRVGKKLCMAVLQKARTLGATQVFLESNRKLTPALELYKKVGFREVPISHTPYARADIKMVADL